jgi:hypothetical protein
MDGNRFDVLTRSLTASRSRRGALTNLASGFLALLPLAAMREGAAAKHGCRHAGTECTKPGQCCSDKCLGSGVCSCDDDNPCPKSTNSCKSPVCRSGRCKQRSKPEGTRCTSDNNVCTEDVCNYTGQCTHPPDPSQNGKICDTASGRICEDGTCACPAGTRMCRGTCLDRQTCCTDDDCDRAAGTTCQGGACKCPTGQEESGGYCATRPECTGLGSGCLRDSYNPCCSGTCNFANRCTASDLGEPCHADHDCQAGQVCQGFVCYLPSPGG